METIKANWWPLASGGPLACAATNLPGDLMATGCKTTTGHCVQVWEQALPSGGWELRSQVQVPEPAVALDWAHPEAGLLLAAASPSGQVHVLEAPRPSLTGGRAGGAQQGPGGPGRGEEEDDEPLEEQEWRVASTLSVPSTSAIRYVGFAPRQYGLLLCVLCADGLVVMWEADRPLAPNSWCLQAKFQAGRAPTAAARLPTSVAAGAGSGCSGLSWRAFTPGLAPLLAVATPREVEVWQYLSAHMTWQRVAQLEPSLSSALAPLTSVHWAPPLGRPVELLAAAHGAKVDVWSLAGDTSLPSSLSVELVGSLEHDSPVHKVEFNRFGTCLGTATESNHVHVWKANLVGSWQLVSVVEGSTDVAAGSSSSDEQHSHMADGLD